MYLLLLIEYAGRLALGAWKPIVTLGTAPGGPASLVLVGVSLLMLLLSLKGGERQESRRAR